MPIYEYKCQGCGHQFELLLIPGKDSSKPDCPEMRQFGAEETYFIPVFARRCWQAGK